MYFYFVSTEIRNRDESSAFQTMLQCPSPSLSPRIFHVGGITGVTGRTQIIKMFYRACIDSISRSKDLSPRAYNSPLPSATMHFNLPRVSRVLGDSASDSRLDNSQSGRLFGGVFDLLAPAGRRPAEKRRTGDIRGEGEARDVRAGRVGGGNRVKSTGVEEGGREEQRSGWVTAHYVISTGS